VTVRRLFACALLLVLGGCGNASPGHRLPLPPPGAQPTSTRSHVIVLVMENKEYGDVIGSANAPYTNRLAARYGLATRSYGIRHPSLPNYIALTSGSTYGIHSDCTGCHVNAPNIATQLDAARITWKAYLEDMPRPCFTGAGAGGYAKKHNPFVYYDDVVSNRKRCRHVVPYGQIATDLRRGRLPAFSFIAPNLCDDTHDCDVRTGDRFLAGIVPALLHALGPHGFFVLTYDEGTSDAGCCGDAHGGHIPTIVAGPQARRGARQTTPVDHYGVLRTLEDTFRLPRLGEARQRRHGSLRPLLRGVPRLR
jgi:hypothetical protein